MIAFIQLHPLLATAVAALVGGIVAALVVLVLFPKELP